MRVEVVINVSFLISLSSGSEVLCRITVLKVFPKFIDKNLLRAGSKKNLSVNFGGTPFTQSTSRQLLLDRAYRNFPIKVKQIKACQYNKSNNSHIIDLDSECRD